MIGIVGEGDGGPPDLPVLGSVEDLLSIVETRAVDEVILTPEASWWRDEISEPISAKPRRNGGHRRLHCGAQAMGLRFERKGSAG